MPAIIKVTKKADGEPFWLVVSSIEGFFQDKKGEGTMVWLTSSVDSFIIIKESPESLLNLIEAATKKEE